MTPPSPWFLVVSYFPILVIVWYLYYKTKQRRYIAVSFFPLSVLAAYIWIGLSVPAFEIRATAIRYVFLFCAGAAYYLLYETFRRR